MVKELHKGCVSLWTSEPVQPGACSTFHSARGTFCRSVPSWWTDWMPVLVRGLPCPILRRSCGSICHRVI